MVLKYGCCHNSKEQCSFSLYVGRWVLFVDRRKETLNCSLNLLLFEVEAQVQASYIICPIDTQCCCSVWKYRRGGWAYNYKMKLRLRWVMACAYEHRRLGNRYPTRGIVPSRGTRVSSWLLLATMAKSRQNL